jgi:hypothetical protein
MMKRRRPERIVGVLEESALLFDLEDAEGIPERM